MPDGQSKSTPLGTWELVSLVSRLPDGSIIEPWGHRPLGRISYSEGGHMMAMIIGDGWNEDQGQKIEPIDQGHFTAYFGTYEINSASDEIIHHVLASMNGKQAAGDLRRNYEISDDNLVLSFRWTFEGKPVENRLVWKWIALA